MARYAYRTNADGTVSEARFIGDDWALAPGELEGHADVLPDTVRILPPSVPKPTIDDIITVLSLDQQAAISAAVAKRLV